ncbi:hypothetical protein PHYSODRAFT_316320 [Phytophthora sojae]|uniref:Elicitin n=1 Tax=Phytophthora sojae (strain P6497) TaxID=1094619 RepID=G4ZPJ6_PHYSP|nr:hypothetical protein PHYSODRAFT_316320 [Phytophthora sojae]EGZ16308.1 hypothetical protein PHYSODRAFT_316320 [Phytophthora sojae]|eukprot:XP_009530057.1 hypothetical protein PHYSODRAFT_316320 [Phytophthora sojae]
MRPGRRTWQLLTILAALSTPDFAPSGPHSFAVAFAAIVSTVSAASSSGSYADCSSSVLSALLTDQYIDQCATDSGYATIDKMCASSACQNLLADVKAMDLSECVIPVGDNILLLADLVDYVPEHCPSSSSGSTTSSTSTATTAPTTTTTTSSASSSTTATETPSTTTATTSSTSSTATSTTSTTAATSC